MKSRYKYLVLFIFLFALFGSIKLIDNNFFANPSSFSFQANNSLSTSSTSNLISEVDTLVVEISGAVLKPGVYTIPNGSRLEDLILLSGGIDNTKADLDLISQSINKAQKLKDQQKVYIPILNTSNNSDININTKLISINNGSYEALISINGIGDALAKKIISNRYYSSLDELVSKKVISNSLYDKINEIIRL